MPTAKRQFAKKPEGSLQDKPISAVRNLGPASARWLRAVHIETFGQLQETGAIAAFLQVRSVYPSASLNLLWALTGALDDRDWRELSATEKQEALEQLARLQQRFSND